MRKAVSMAFVAALVSFAAYAEPLSIRLEPGKSSVSFSLGATLHTVKGTMRLSGGVVRLDPATHAASGSLRADAASANTGNAKRDRDMHAKVLESARFPEVAFTFEGVDGTIQPAGTSSVRVRGQFAIHGGTHTFSFPATITINGANATGSASFEIPYVRWGMHDPSKALIRVDKAVKVNVSLVGTIEH
jgi:polyisoprenoid-binding protein YceI